MSGCTTYRHCLSGVFGIKSTRVQILIRAQRNVSSCADCHCCTSSASDPSTGEFHICPRTRHFRHQMTGASRCCSIRLLRCRSTHTDCPDTGSAQINVIVTVMIFFLNMRTPFGYYSRRIPVSLSLHLTDTRNGKVCHRDCYKVHSVMRKEHLYVKLKTWISTNASQHESP